MSTDIPIHWEPHIGVSPNSRLSTRGKQYHKKRSREQAAKDMKAWLQAHAFIIPDQPVLEVTWYRGKGRNRWDLDNLLAAYKGVIDEVCKHLGFDDRRIISMHAYQKKSPGGQGYSVITIRDSTQEERRKAA